MSWRIPAALAVLALLAWVGWEIARAGGDITVARVAGNDVLTQGRISSKRIDGRAWSLDYDTVTMSPDQSEVSIAHVRDGRIHRDGKPDVLLKADGVTGSTVTNDLAIKGPMTCTEQIGGNRTRTFRTTGARYVGATHKLELPHTVTITEGDATIVVAKAAVNFRTGDVYFGRLEGTKTGS